MLTPSVFKFSEATSLPLAGLTSTHSHEYQKNLEISIVFPPVPLFFSLPFLLAKHKTNGHQVLSSDRRGKRHTEGKDRWSSSAGLVRRETSLNTSDGDVIP